MELSIIKMREEIIRAMNDGLGPLHPREISLLKKIRTDYRFGSIEVTTYDGLPKQIVKTIVRENLD